MVLPTLVKDRMTPALYPCSGAGPEVVEVDESLFQDLEDLAVEEQS